MATKAQKILKILMKSSSARTALAKAMVAPLLQRIDYSSIARKAIVVEYLCEVCGQYVKKHRLYKDDFTLSRKPKTEHAVGKGSYRVCLECVKDTRTKLSCMNDMPIKDMPKYLADPNIFVRKRALKRLEGQ